MKMKKVNTLRCHAKRFDMILNFFEWAAGQDVK